jgi:hypothetical protein
VSRLVAWVAALMVGGCATIDVYHWEPKPLPAGSEPLAVVSWSLNDLRNISWSYGEPDPDPSRRAHVEATVSGLAGAPKAAAVAGTPLDLTYAEIAEGVRMVTQSSGLWTVYIYDKQNRRIEMEFSSYAAARLFLDATWQLARQPVTPAVEISALKSTKG